MASADVAEMAGLDCAVQCLYKMLLCSACLPLAAAVLLGLVPLLFLAPWGILYMALVSGLTNQVVSRIDLSGQDRSLAYQGVSRIDLSG